MEKNRETIRLEEDGYENVKGGYEPREQEQDREYEAPDGGSGESDSSDNEG